VFVQQQPSPELDAATATQAPVPRYSPVFDRAAEAQGDSRIHPVPINVVAFVGRCWKGPIHTPTVVTDFVEFENRFGGRWVGSTLPQAVENFFEHGGKQALIVRVASGGRAPSIDLPAGNQRLVLQGISPGTHEFLRASVDHDGITRHDADLFNLVVQRVRIAGSELVETQEIYRRVSILPESARSATRVLAASKLVRVVNPLPAQRPDITRGPDPRSLIGYVVCNNDGDDGIPLSDYDLIGSEADATGLFALRGEQPFNFLHIPPPAEGRDLGMSVLLVAARFCRTQHALLLVDPPQSWKTTSDAQIGLADWPFHSADAVMFFPPLHAWDPLGQQLSAIGPTACAIGTLLRSEAYESFWRDDQEPALLRPSATPVQWLDRLQRLRFAQQGVNVVRATRTPLRDVIPLRTLVGESGSPEDRSVAARRLALLITASIERGTRWVVVEGNTERSRERVRRQVEQFLLQFAEVGAFTGANRQDDFFVLCDERLNGAAAHAEGRFSFVYGYKAATTAARHTWLVEHRAAGSVTRATSLNQLADLALSVR
jgi:uncharacterized protein